MRANNLILWLTAALTLLGTAAGCGDTSVMGDHGPSDDDGGRLTGRASEPLAFGYTPASSGGARDDAIPVPDVTGDGWFAGDGHVHSRYSVVDAAYIKFDCLAPSVETQVEAAADAGLSWVMLTDHDDKMFGFEWEHQHDDSVPDALTAVHAAQPGTSLETADSGVELGSTIPPSNLVPDDWPDWFPDPTDDVLHSMALGHFLGYGMTSFLEWEEEFELDGDGIYPSAHAMLQAVYANGTGSVAHPYNQHNPWEAWRDFLSHAATHDVGFEVINGGELDRRALATWQDLVHSGLRLHVVGNSDAHCPDDVASSVTFVRLQPGENLGTDTVMSALEDGRIVASDGPFVSFFVHNPASGAIAEIGETLTAETGQEIELIASWRTHGGDDVWDDASFGQISSIQVYDRSHRFTADPQDGNPLELDPPLDTDHGVTGTTGEATRTYTVESSGALWLVAETTAGRRAIANPVFIDVPGSPFTGTNLDTALIIDASGSMSSNDPDEHRINAAKFYVDLARPGDHAAVISFNSSAQVRAALQEATANRDALHHAADLIGASGGTNISGGMLAGWEELDSSDSNHEKIAILLTDGDGSYNNEADLFAAEGWRVYTIGLGGGANGALLQDIADTTGGTYTQVATLDDAEDALEQIYRDISTDVTGLTQVLEDAIELLLGEWMSWLIDVTDDIDLLRVSITWPGSEFDLRLVRPDGVVLDENVSDPDVIYAEGDTYAVFSIAYPMAGQWTAEVTAVNVGPTGETVSITAAANTSAMPEVWFVDPAPEGDQSGTVTVTIETSDLEGVTSIALAVDDIDLVEVDTETLQHDWDTTAVDDGFHTLWATVRDVDGNMAVASRPIYVLNDAASLPELDAGPDTTATAGQPVVLTATPLNDAADSALFLWDLGDGEVGGGISVEHMYAIAGEYTIIAYATSEQQLTGYDFAVVTVLDPADVDDDGDGHTENLGDCDDGDASVFPGASETCDGRDENCDGSIDEGFDTDGDGYLSATLCGPLGDDCDDEDPALTPADDDGDGWSTCAGDCDDGDPAASPADADGDGASACDGDCDDTDPSLSLADLDGDGVSSCDGDCLDTDLATHPGADEWCDARDNDCDGAIDEDALDALTWYADADGDGYGDATDAGLPDCDAPDGYAPNALDCDDSDPSLDASDLDGDGFSTCDGDCDDLDPAVDPADTDQDGHSSCAGDCDDFNNTLTPDDLDGDNASPCEGDCDDADPLLNPLDLDHDGYTSCDGDCNDVDDQVFPGNNETCDDGIDNDCDGSVDVADADCPAEQAPKFYCQLGPGAPRTPAPTVVVAMISGLALITRRRSNPSPP